jgi:FkbM family methyltransferase
MSQLAKRIGSYWVILFFQLHPLMACNQDSSWFLSNKLQYSLVDGLPNIYLDPLSEHIGHTWQYGQVWDKPLIQKFYSLLTAHNDFFVVIDLGAQTGSFSLLAKYFPNSSWHAFEPIKEAADTLKANLILNEIHNVFVHQMAASNKREQASLKMPNLHEWGLATLGSNVLRFSPTGEREIECIDLDSFVNTNQIERVHFMKLDTEGWELRILQGSRELLERDHPIILMEYNEINMKQCGIQKNEVDNFLTDLGYEWSLISTEDILCIPKDMIYDH